MKYRMLLFLTFGLAFCGFVKMNSKDRVEAKSEEEINEDIYDIDFENTTSFNIYVGDYSNYGSKLAKTVEIDKNMKLIDKVKKVATCLSETLYDELPIEVSIEDRGGKKVAIVNLVEPLASNNKEFDEIYETLEDKKGTWKYYFNSGEARAIVTRKSIEATFYQKDINSEWIDGFMIFRNGETLDDYSGKGTTDITWIKK